MTDYLNELNESQRAAVLYNEFPKCMRSRRRWGVFELLFGAFVFFWSCLVICIVESLFYIAFILI